MALRRQDTNQHNGEELYCMIEVADKIKRVRTRVQKRKRMSHGADIRAFQQYWKILTRRLMMHVRAYMQWLLQSDDTRGRSKTLYCDQCSLILVEWSRAPCHPLCR